ncbi:MAG: glycine betaine ABC transporter substrate-binding protein [Dehalococcoidales bacterium]|nr:glycine betaine ABC transporter substrate-binding protein [Dehalococcoidales bacterium]
MDKTRFWRTKWLALFSVMLMAVMLVVGCGTEEQQQEKPTIRFWDGAWESQWLHNAIGQFVVEEGYGYPTETVELTEEVFMALIAEGDVDVNMEEWFQNCPDWYDKHIKDGTIEAMGNVLEGGPQFFCIPKWVAEEYNIKTVFDMKDHWELFKDPEDPSKGSFINGIYGWTAWGINDVKLEAYGLYQYYNSISPGSTGAEMAALAGPQKQHQPVFGYYWAPTSLMGMFDWYILEEPEYNDEVWAQILAAIEDPTLRPLDEACAYPDQAIPIIVHKGLRAKAPDVVAMLEKLNVGIERCNKTLAWAEENEVRDWEKAAVWFLREYDSHWQTWVTPEAYNKIKEALDEYGPIP